MTSCRHSACVPAQRLCRMRTIVKEMFMTQSLPLSFGIYLHYQTNIHCPLIVILLTSSQSNTSTLISCQNGKQNQQALKLEVLICLINLKDKTKEKSCQTLF
ncbi:hypothetical protein D917_09885 [Trichinella nativa]|uniref:Uncharacterized protein n=1 Tax=Trichinella nativa TaxID=6335 RepID=A0A1Y3EHE5_9BILA|nr:hypothetical protein D917_09885 [Trichinella nativa]